MSRKELMGCAAKVLQVRCSTAYFMGRELMFSSSSSYKFENGICPLSP